MRNRRPTVGHAGTGMAGGWLAASWMAALALVAIGALIIHAGTAGFGTLTPILTDPTVWRIVRFTLWQALLSALCSTVLAIPLAIALHRAADGAPKRALLALFALPLALPQIVAVLGIIALYGERGVVTRLASTVGLDLPSIYGLTGILIVHVFFNLPLAARIVHSALATMPVEYERLADQLGLGVVSRFRHVYWPVMRPALAGATALLLLLCITSFAVVLILGGPGAVTLEVALYQALVFDFDIGRAVVLTLLQLTITIAAMVTFATVSGAVPAGMTLGPSPRQSMHRPGGAKQYLASIWLVLAALFVAAPFIMIVIGGLGADLPRLVHQPSVQQAFLTSLSLGVAAALLALALAIMICRSIASQAAQRRFTGRPGLLETALTQMPALILVVPSIVLAAGWFIALRAVTNVYAAAPYLIIAINAAMAMPFAARLLLPAILANAERHDRLCAHLGLVGRHRLRLVVWPVLRPAIIAAFAFAFALSLGDLGVIALFGSEQVQTLPYLIMQRMGSYRTQDAAGLALILCAMTMVLMIAAEHFARRTTPAMKNAS